jgi:hypothetical protein
MDCRQHRLLGELRSHRGSLFQSLRDTPNEPPSADWVCVAGRGADGVNGRSLKARGRYDSNRSYSAFDVVTFADEPFVALRDDPGLCPGEAWSRLRGPKGERGERGLRGGKGERAKAESVVVINWQIDRQKYRASPLMSDGTVGAPLELRELFAQFGHEADIAG